MTREKDFKRNFKKQNKKDYFTHKMIKKITREEKKKKRKKQKEKKKMSHQIFWKNQNLFGYIKA